MITIFNFESRTMNEFSMFKYLKHFFIRISLEIKKLKIQNYEINRRPWKSRGKIWENPS